MDHKQIPTFDLRHYARESGVDKRVEGWVAEDVVRKVNLEAFMRGYWRGNGMQE